MRRDVDSVRAVLAYLVVGGGMLLVAVAWVARGPDAERLATALAGLIGLVLGYYFGSRAGERA